MSRQKTSKYERTVHLGMTVLDRKESIPFLVPMLCWEPKASWRVYSYSRYGPACVPSIRCPSPTELRNPVVQASIFFMSVTVALSSRFYVCALCFMSGMWKSKYYYDQAAMVSSNKSGSSGSIKLTYHVIVSRRNISASWYSAYLQRRCALSYTTVTIPERMDSFKLIMTNGHF